MKQVIFIVILIISSISCNNSNKRNISKEKNKRSNIDLRKFAENRIFPIIFDTNQYVDITPDSNIIDGTYIGIYKDSIIAFTGKYRNKKPEGLFHFYAPNGKLKETRIYEHGLEHGPVTFWNENGELEECLTYVNGKEEGYHYTWWNYNTIRSKSYYKSGKYEGQVINYYRNGAIDHLCNYHNNIRNGLSIDYYPNGKIEQVGYYMNDYQIGTWKSYYRNGQLKSLNYYAKSVGRKELEYIKSFHKRMCMGEATLPIGIWVQYDSLGNILTKTYYDKLFTLRREDEFFPTGQLHFRSYYNGEVPYMCSRNPGYRVNNGLYEEYFPNGEIRIRGYYTNNSKSGCWKTYDKAGKVIKIEDFGSSPK
ncbi:toxin-antitoxin system YwqK family antitoxin [Parabacteroides sp. FAFU027]|uniref:toxin-antitoxin system YwqK family antitoxin n=1 Tax=Parabacteroides sp. FAFU027 TaxID=2922715 RepID=UPI001FAFDE20|nr:hypothetical protein [Parabacteroides sp. FAFU027]